jgi:hypothetical protein
MKSTKVRVVQFIQEQILVLTYFAISLGCWSIVFCHVYPPIACTKQSQYKLYHATVPILIQLRSTQKKRAGRFGDEETRRILQSVRLWIRGDETCSYLQVHRYHRDDGSRLSSSPCKNSRD